MVQARPGVHVDANRVVAILREQLADAHVQNAVLSVALEDAQAVISELSTELAKARDKGKEEEPGENPGAR